MVGGKNSAAEAALELFRAGARDARPPEGHAWGLDQKWVRPDVENRIKEGSIAARFETHVVEIRPDVVVVDRGGVRDEIPADGVLLLTGYRPDVDLMRRVGIRCDEETLAPELNPETFETNVPESVHCGWGSGGAQHRIHLHREWPLSRRADYQGARRAVQPLTSPNPSFDLRADKTIATKDTTGRLPQRTQRTPSG